MTKVRQDLTGQRFEKLVAIRQVKDYIAPNGNHFPQYLCRCDCGNECMVLANHLKSGHTKSCGHCGLDENGRNIYEDKGDYMIGYTSKGEKFYFDKEDYNLVKDYTWHIELSGYVTTKVKKEDGNHKTLLMHRLVMGISDEQHSWDRVIDHKKKGKKYRSDNRKENLWICTISDNGHNMSINTRNTSGCSGVYWDKQNKRWRAYISINGERIQLGCFKKFTDAVKARRDAEILYWGKENQDFSKILEITLDKE